MIHKLDLGGTACYESKDAVSVSLDGSASGDEVVHRVIADYRFLPFQDNQFDEALGSCFLEDPFDEIEQAFREVIRACNVGAIIKVKSCGGPEMEHYTIPDKLGLELIEEPSFWSDCGSVNFDDPYVWAIVATTKEQCLASETSYEPPTAVVLHQLIIYRADGIEILDVVVERGWPKAVDKNGVEYCVVAPGTF